MFPAESEESTRSPSVGNPENQTEIRVFSRRVLTDALIGMVTDEDQINIDEFTPALIDVQGLLEKLNSDNHDPSQSTLPRPQVTTLKDNFLNSEKIATRLGMKLD